MHTYTTHTERGGFALLNHYECRERCPNIEIMRLNVKKTMKCDENGNAVSAPARFMHSVIEKNFLLWQSTTEGIEFFHSLSLFLFVSYFRLVHMHRIRI